MKKKDARKIAIDYLWNASQEFYSISSKTTIDDRGTLSDDGYTDSECEEIQKELDFLVKQFIHRTL